MLFVSATSLVVTSQPVFHHVITWKSTGTGSDRQPNSQFRAILTVRTHRNRPITPFDVWTVWAAEMLFVSATSLVVTPQPVFHHVITSKPTGTGTDRQHNSQFRAILTVRTHRNRPITPLDVWTVWAAEM